MRYFFTLAVFAASLCQVSLLLADDGLFSEVAMESVFAKPALKTESVATKEPTDQYARVTSASSLAEVLKTLGFEPVISKGHVKISLPHEGWKFPVSFAVQVDQDRIDCQMSLIVIGDGGTATGTLLDLLAVGDSAAGAFFAYDRDRKLIQLRTSFSNRSVTANQLKADLSKLAVFAEKHSGTWTKLRSKTTTLASSSTSRPANTSRAKTSTPQLSLLGRWSASVSANESFAIAMTRDSKFQLVHLKSGKPTISKGKATRSGNRLTLAGEGGITLNCQVQQITADKFRLTILNAQGKATVNLDFKKAK